MQIKSTSSNLGYSIKVSVALIILGPLLLYTGSWAQKTYLLVFHILSSLYLGGGFFISMSYLFRTQWAMEVQGASELWEMFSFRWPLLFLPFLFIGNEIFPWSDFSHHKGFYFETWFLVLRFVCYSLMTIYASHHFKKAPLALILFIVSGTLFTFDTAMCLEVNWSSNMYPLVYFANGALGFLSLFLIFLSKRKYITADYGRLLVTVAAVWAYFHYSQFLIMWMGNKPEEVSWYLQRSFRTLPLLAILIISLKLIPVMGLGLLGKLKKNQQIVRIVSVAVALAFFLEINWLLAPPLKMNFLVSVISSLVFVSLTGLFIFRWYRRYA